MSKKQTKKKVYLRKLYKNKYNKPKLKIKVIFHRIKCGECNAKMLLRKSKYGIFYGCSQYPMCKGTHGCHPNGTPLGKPANSEVRQLRRRIHQLAENIWHWKEASDRRAMYAWFRAYAPREHIAQMNKIELQITEDLLRAKISKINAIRNKKD